MIRLREVRHLRRADAILAISLFLLLIGTILSTVTRASETVPPEAVTGLVVKRYSQTAAEAFWTRTTTPGLRYEILLDGVPFAMTRGVSIFIDSLASGINPLLSVTAIAADGQRAPTSSLRLPPFGSTVDAPNAPADLRAQRYSATAGELFWSGPRVPGLHHEVSRNGGTPVITTGYSFFDDQLTSLGAATYQVVAIDEQGDRSVAAIVSMPAFGEPDTGLAPPTGLRAMRYSASAAELFWERAPEPGMHYEIARPGNGTATTNGTSYFADRLGTTAAVSFSVVAVDRSGRRSAPASITAPAFGDIGEPTERLITLASYDLVLRELVSLINGAPLIALLESRPGSDDEGITEIGVTGPVEDVDLGLGFLHELSCDAGGGIQRHDFPSSHSRMRLNECRLADGVHDGELLDYPIGREGRGIDVTDYQLNEDNRARSLSGDYGQWSYRSGNSRIIYWRDDTRYSDEQNGETLVVSHLNLDSQSAYDYVQQLNRSLLDASFEVRAPWTEQQRVRVEVSLEAYLEPGATFTWQAGELRAVADDGSSLTLTPADSDSRGVDITLSDGSDPIRRSWSDGFEIECAFHDLDSCSDF